MDSSRNFCRLCLKLTSDENLLPLFENNETETNFLEWRRMFSFIYDFQGLPDKICNNCKTQAEWILNFHKQCYENDVILRSNQISAIQNELPEKYDINTSNIYDDEAANITDNNQFHESKEFDYDADDFEEYEEKLMLMELSKGTLAVENHINYFMDQEQLAEETGKALQTEKTEKEIIIFKEGQLKEGLELDHQMDYSTEDPSDINSNLTDSNVINESLVNKLAYNCPICGKSFTAKSNKERHQKKHENAKPFQCTFSECDKKFSSKTSRDGHIKSIHENLTYKCPACKYIRRYRNDIAIHIRKEHRGTGLQPLELEA